jgi:hypothetical protein
MAPTKSSALVASSLLPSSWSSPGSTRIRVTLAQPGSRQPLGVLHRPHARFDAHPDPHQDLHELHSAGLGEVDGGVIWLVPGPHEPKAALGVWLYLGAGSHAHGHPAGLAHPRDRAVHRPSLQSLAPFGVARVHVDSAGPGRDAGRGVAFQFLDGHRRGGMGGLCSVAVEGHLQQAVEACQGRSPFLGALMTTDLRGIIPD